MKKIITLLSLILVGAQLSAQDRVNLVSALNANTEKINSVQSGSDFQDLEPIGLLIQNKKIIALGEATHGTREHFLFKFRMIKYMVLEHNLKIIAFEGEMAGFERVNQFVLDADDRSDLRKILAESGMFSVFITNEIMEMLIWIKNYNKDQPENEKVNFQGMDVQYPLRVSLRILQNPILVSLLNENEKKSLIEFANLFKVNSSAKVPLDLLERVSSLSKKLKKRISNSEKSDSLSFYLQSVSLLQQSVTMANKSIYLNSYYRDRFMADNIAWLASQNTDDRKIVVWAHNSHISKGLLSKYRAMGNWLVQRFGERYYALALLAGEGSARLYENTEAGRFLKSVSLPALSNVNSIEYIFANAKYENFYLDLQKAKKSSELKALFTGDKYIRNIGSAIIPPVDIKVNLKNSFDGLVFFRKTTAATLD